MRVFIALIGLMMIAGCDTKPDVKPHFVCPKCAQPTLAIVFSMELGRDNNWDERSLQVIQCVEEGDEGLATYLEDRSGSNDIVRHQGKWGDSKSLKKIRESLNQCPAPQDPKCDCAAHQMARKLDIAGMPGSFFPMKIIQK